MCGGLIVRPDDYLPILLETSLCMGHIAIARQRLGIRSAGAMGLLGREHRTKSRSVRAGTCVVV